MVKLEEIVERNFYSLIVAMLEMGTNTKARRLLHLVSRKRKI